MTKEEKREFIEELGKEVSNSFKNKFKNFLIIGETYNEKGHLVMGAGNQKEIILSLAGALAGSEDIRHIVKKATEIAIKNKENVEYPDDEKVKPLEKKDVIDSFINRIKDYHGSL